MPVGCEARRDEMSLHSLLVSDDGGVIVYAKCYGPPGSGMVGACTTFKQSGNAVSASYADTVPLAVAKDGSAILLQDGDSVDWVRADGTKLDTPFGAGASMSLDGRAIFGLTLPDADGVRNLARWTEATGVEPLGPLPGTWISDWRIVGVSEGGRVVAGVYYQGTVSGAFHWDAGGGMQDFGALPGGATAFTPNVVSRDGSTIAGVSENAEGTVDILRWTAAGFEVLGSAVPRGSFEGLLLRLSPDGIRLGATTDTNGFPQLLHAGAAGLSVAAIDGPTQFIDMTLDGAVLLGNGSYGGNGPGFIWRPSASEAPASGQLQYISDMLAANAVDSSGWALGPATNVSPDGRSIFGVGTCGGVPAFYRWVLPD